MAPDISSISLVSLPDNPAIPPEVQPGATTTAEVDRAEEGRLKFVEFVDGFGRSNA